MNIKHRPKSLRLSGLTDVCGKVSVYNQNGRGGNRESEKKDYVDVESQKAWDAERASGDGVRTPNFS